MAKVDVYGLHPIDEPAALGEAMASLTPGAKASVGIIVKGDGSLWYSMAGGEHKDILWALQHMIHTLMAEPPDSRN